VDVGSTKQIFRWLKSFGTTSPYCSVKKRAVSLTYCLSPVGTSPQTSFGDEVASGAGKVPKNEPWQPLLADRLYRLATEQAQGFATALPFPHCVLDSFLPQEVAEKAEAAFSDRKDSIWRRYEHSNSKKLACSDPTSMPEEIRSVLLFMNSRPFIACLEKLTGIGELVADPNFNGGGIHCIESGGFLKIHADFNLHPTLNLYRRLNVLLYLNKEWRDEYRGDLELWDRSMSHCMVRIAPVFNRCVVFATSDTSYHGHPDALRCPPDMVRKSLATYYYTAVAASEQAIVPHSTLYRRRPDET
jgi:hypothetical protein